jgi:hypothetical protein
MALIAAHDRRTGALKPQEIRAFKGQVVITSQMNRPACISDSGPACQVWSVSHAAKVAGAAFLYDAGKTAKTTGRIQEQ